MKKDEEFLEEEFDDYLDGKLTTAEKAGFEARLSVDPGLREAFDFHQAIREALRGAARRAERKKEIGGIRQQIPSGKPRNRGWLKSLVLMLVLLVLAGGIWYFWSSQSNQEEKQETTPPGPIAESQDSSSEVISSASRKPDLEIKPLHAKRFRIIRGQRHPGTAGDYEFVAWETTVDRPVAILTEKRIEVFFPERQLPQDGQIGMTELQVDQKTRLYLQIGAVFYELYPGEHPLIAVTDPQVLDWLK